ncbi:hypothetical protein MYU51_020023 [Penicillium brevicompactum]|uniref:60S ribosome biogenesis protein Mak11 n=1 Tax=Penicillium brevicompactum TaxID=5074 RepID=A0A9W9Q8U8_PENBR|nr:uncharacterized protein N7506_004066 [Penicillium brevicompactum]KAJ5327808.1 hypothetical protein N7452_008198 [Penicillium brevicompactum]KAJ5336044.1 hypothetical protein N7506_004066 [Penicillium brevicompactum]
MVKRKRTDAPKEEKTAGSPPKSTKSAPTPTETTDAALTVQVITGSYERVLHGFTAGIPASHLKAKTDDELPNIQCADTFLFEAHGSAIRCLALSPLPKSTDSTDAQTVMLASGSTDERINLYSISAAPPAVNEEYPSVPTFAGNKILENPRNRELGALLHHTASITSLSFPSRSKLLAAGEDNTISVSKTRDWTVVSSIKAPNPKVQGRPSGDTAPPGAAPSGVNHFAVHPSMKLMLSIGRGEKCMRLWNLVTGRKAGVLNFTREVLQGVKESRWSTGEGRRIAWDSEGEEFAVAFEWGAVVFGIDSVPRCRLIPGPRSKLHQMKYVSLPVKGGEKEDFLAVSTEDGRVIFYSTKELKTDEEDTDCSIPHATPVAQLGGKQAGFPGRIKDFELLSLEGQAKEYHNDVLFVTGNSDGVVRVWKVSGKDVSSAKKDKETTQIGRLLTTAETGNRITCLAAFVMLPAEDPSTLIDSGNEDSEDDEAESSSDSDDE